ncbi:cysteine proteinase [Rhizoclosmatium globosum]|uniref:Cysteine proteinase n=1 Tax=Rhizoclosmatium globosum TaxID=329046 RepID=A0A1Y2BQ54_9FUNG|nr:cysteine proteinase [Rhizoclosmatium globosum]|eukprot:ORY36846.1 cysteine proteinase [Rhizoclosmatium globosum]
MTVPKRSAALKYIFNKQPSTPRGLVGLTNLGNTCFMNSILQCIFATELLMGYFLSSDYLSDLNLKSPMKGQLANSFAQVVQDALAPANRTHVLNPSRFKRQIDNWAPQFAGYNQQDAQEFLRFMLDGLHEDLNRVTVRPRYTYKDVDVDKLSDVDKARFSWHRYMPGTAVSYLVRLQRILCILLKHFRFVRRSTTKHSSMPHLPSPIHNIRHILGPLPPHPKATKCTLTDCLLEFSASEVLPDLYRCDACKTRSQASKRLRIYKTPEILVLHLKRFTNSRDKIETFVQFPLRRLSLESVMTDTPGHDQIVYYDLFGVSSHMGGLGGGHYVAHQRSWDTGLWYEKNDSVVREVDEGRIEGLGRSGYVLFFQKSRQ